MEKTSRFVEVQPTMENYWRSIILFGRNVASYKFALGKSLLELAPTSGEFVRLEDLAEPYSRSLCEHLNVAEKQVTSSSSKFLDACRRFNEKEIAKEELIDTTVKLGFNNVIDAFHVVGSGDVGVRFFQDERGGRQKGIRLTQDLLRLLDQYQAQNLPQEVEARWRLVETAWNLGLPRQVLSVRYEPEAQILVADDPGQRRPAITGCRDGLNGYQKGKCFYCFGDISVVSTADDLADVDHFIPRMLQDTGMEMSLDGVWNLVLACRGCNRGEQGKMALLPELRFLERLHDRNSFFIDSHHPLRETLMRQAGETEPERKAFLQEVYKHSKELLVQNWKPPFEYEPAF